MLSFFVRLVITVIMAVIAGGYATYNFTALTMEVFDSTGAGEDLGGHMWELGFGLIICFFSYPFWFACFAVIPRWVFRMETPILRMIVLSYIGVLAIVLVCQVTGIIMMDFVILDSEFHWIPTMIALGHALLVVCYYEASLSELSF